MLDQHLIVRTSPIAHKENIVIWRDYRVTVLFDRLFRLEKSKNGLYRDNATTSVWYRNTEKQDFTVKCDEEKCLIITKACRLLLKRKRDDCRISIGQGYKRINNDDNLLGTFRTLDKCDGGRYIAANDRPDSSDYIKLGYGVCSKSGLAVLDDSESLTLDTDGKVKPIIASGSDEYIFAYGHDYKAAVRAMYAITGFPPLIPRFALGNWWSRYHVYTDLEYLRLLAAFEERKIPLSVATIDMDWHYSNKLDEEIGLTASGKNMPEYIGGKNPGWTGYTWNKNLFPDYKGFLKKITARNIKITLNLHPCDGFRWWDDCYAAMAQVTGIDPKTCLPVPFDFTNDDFINAYFSIAHKPYEEDGVAFWWIDWQQGTKSRLEGLDPLWALNHYHTLDNAKNHRTPLILSRYAGVGSHRYPLGFSGDTYITWNTLNYLPYFTATATNIGYTWWSHDIGGHMLGEMDEDLYLRHIQFGVFSPIFRLHCSNEETVTKEPWYYGNGVGYIVQEMMRLRHRMIPYLYSAAYRTHSKGLALIEPLYYEWEQPEAYQYKNQYLFGSEMLVIPITTKQKQDGYAYIKAWLPEGVWTDFFTGDIYDVPKNGKKLTLMRKKESIPVLVKAGGIIPLSGDKGNSVANPQKMDVLVYNGEGEYDLYEDLLTEEKEGQAITHFKTYTIEDNNIFKQILTIRTAGDDGVIPENRELTVRFKNISEGEITVYKDGKLMTIEEVLTDCAAVRVNHERNAEIRIEVLYKKLSALDYLQERARKVLLGVEGDNIKKSMTYEMIKKATSIAEYVLVVDNSEVSLAAKKKLKEVL